MKLKLWFKDRQGLWDIIDRQAKTIKELQRSIKSYKGWNTRQRKEIAELKAGKNV